MKTVIALLIGCTLAFAGAVMAQNPETQESPTKKGGGKQKTEQTTEKPSRNAGAGGEKKGGHNAANPENPSTTSSTTGETGASGAQTGAGKGKHAHAAKSETSATGETNAESPTTTGTATGTGAATTETGGKGKHGRGKGGATERTTAETGASVAPSASVSAQTGGGKGKHGKGAAAQAGASASAAPSASVSASASTSTTTSASAAPSASVATGATGTTTTSTGATATGGATMTKEQGTVGRGGKKVETQQVQQIKQQHASFKAQPKPNVAPAVTFNVNYRLPGAERWQGPQYEVFRSYHPERHDRGWYHSRYQRVELIAGGYYYWNNGYWYPAWGYDPGHEYYAYDAPIYVGHSAEPPDKVIADVQAELQDMGYYTGEVDGLLGPLTRQALRDYQADHGLMVTEVIDEPTLDALQLS